MTVTIEPADLSDASFASLVNSHVLFCDETAPAESCHRLPLAALSAEDVTVWQAVTDGEIVGMGALKALSQMEGEIKSMHTLKVCRGKGVGRQMLATIIKTAKARGYTDLWLETGVHPGFQSAHKMYSAFGFVEVGPFGDYTQDPHSKFMRLDLTAERTA